MLLKAGVDISRLNREIRRSLGIIEEWVGIRGVELVVTSTYEGNHMVGSLHYGNDAVDIRRPLDASRAAVVSLRQKLGLDFDVVDYPGKIHIEYDPKGVSGEVK